MVRDGKEGYMHLNIAGISSMSFDWSADGFGVPCDRCGVGNAVNRLSGDMPPGIPGHYCDPCHKKVCREASEYHQKEFEEATKKLKTTVLSRKDGEWSSGEIQSITDSIGKEVWYDQKHPKHLVIHGHCSRVASRALSGTVKYSVERVVGTGKLPFLPF